MSTFARKVGFALGNFSRDTDVKKPTDATIWWQP